MATTLQTQATFRMSDRLKTIDLSLHDLGTNFAKGLDTVTRAIHETKDVEIGDPET